QVALSEANEQCRKLGEQCEEMAAALESAKRDAAAAEKVYNEAIADREGAESAVIRDLRKQLDEALAAAKTAKAELARRAEGGDKRAGEIAELQKQIAQLGDKLKAALADKKAAEDL